jgi:hypothetical protein
MPKEKVKVEQIHTLPRSHMAQIVRASIHLPFTDLATFFQRGANLYLPFLTYVFLERIFQNSDQKSTEVAILQALSTCLFFRVLVTCLYVLQKSLWSRIVQSCRRRLAGTSLYCFLTQDEE